MKWFSTYFQIRWQRRKLEGEPFWNGFLKVIQEVLKNKFRHVGCQNGKWALQNTLR